jgi:hypothetical protein
MFTEFPIDFSALDFSQCTRLLSQTQILENAMENAISFKLNAGKNVGNYNLAKCRDVTDHTDKVFTEALQISDLWGEIELMYTQIVRTSFEDETDN